MTPMLSVIVPVYNIEAYVEECIKSVLSQTFSDFELILVDDGSTDQSGKICDFYAGQDGRVIVVHKPNGGLPAARNTGLGQASGQFIAFLDGDDFWSEGALAPVMDAVTKNGADITFCAFNHFYPQSTKTIDYRFDNALARPPVDRVKILSALFSNDEVCWPVYRSIYRRDMLTKHQILFDKNLVGVEDCDFFMDCMTHIESFCAVHTSLVNYRCLRPGSITCSAKLVHFQNILRIYKKWYLYFKAFPEKDARPILQCFADLYYDNLLTKAFRLDATQRDEFIREAQNAWFMLADARGKKRLLYDLSKIIGKKAVLRLIAARGPAC